MPLIGNGCSQIGHMSFSMKRHLGDRKTLQDKGLKPDFIFNQLMLDNSNPLSSFLFSDQSTTITSDKGIGKNKYISTYNRNLKISRYKEIK